MICRLFFFTLCGMSLFVPAAMGADQNDKLTKEKAPKFELFDGDRVVFLGNTLIEREQKYGYWETMLTARYPDRNIIFRNLGWDGDTVWAESRGIFDPPEKGYQRMLQHVGRIKPTVIFLGYGNNEAFAGQQGLPAFIRQYNKLLDDLKKVSTEGVRFVILSPTRHEHLEPPLPDPKEINLKTEIYSKAISEFAQQRKLQFVDLFSTVVSADLAIRGVFKYGDRNVEYDFSVTSDGQHLRNSGYKKSAESIYSQLALGTATNLELNVDGTVKETKGMKIQNFEATKKGLRFTMTIDRLLIDKEWFYDIPISRIAISGLPQGIYTLQIDGEDAPAVSIRAMDSEEELNLTFRNLRIIKAIHSYSSRKWEKGVPLNFGPDYDQLEKLRQAVIEKNLLYFHSWRPQNVTYLFLFRKHEQGQNAKEVEEFRKLVAEKEQEIARLKKPVAHTYELIRVKEEDN